LTQSGVYVKFRLQLLYLKHKGRKMFAVIKTGGKQYKVQQGDILQVEKLGAAKEKAITFDEVLLVEDGKKTLIGTPFVAKAKVHAVVVENFKDKKVIVFKKKRRKQYKKTHGHRQELTRVRIEDITIGTAAPKKVEKEEPKKKIETKKQVKDIKPAPAKAATKTVPAKPETSKPAPTKKTAPAKTGKKAAAPKSTAAKPAAKKTEPKAAPKKTAAAKPPSKTKKVTKTKEK